MKSLSTSLVAAATSDRAVVFVSRDGTETRLSYRVLADRARRTASTLAGAGVRPGERVGIVLGTSPTLYDAIFGALALGAVPVPLYPPLRIGDPAEYQRRTRAMLGAADCAALVTDASVAPLVAPCVDAVRACGVLLLGAEPNGPLHPLVDAEPDDEALVQFSSGTTVAPKGVRLTHRQILANVEAIRSLIVTAWPEHNGQRHTVACWLPLYHDMGLVGCVFAALVHQADLVLLPPELFVADPAAWLRAIHRHRATVSPAPNFAFAWCADRIADEDLRGLDLSSWRVALNGAEAVTEAAMARFVHRFGPHGFRADALTPVYGMSEGTLLVAASDPRALPCPVRFDRALLEATGRVRRVEAGGTTLYAVGRAVPGTELQIRDPDGAPLGEDRLGRIWMRGPSRTDGYVGDAVAAIDPDGWLDTADLGFVHGGELFVYGRADDVVVLRGRSCGPDAFERAAERVAGVRKGRTAAFGVPDPSTGTEALIVMVERARTQDTTERASGLALAAAVANSVAEETGFRPAVSVVEAGALPLTTNGKVRRKAARSRWLEAAGGRA